MMRGVLSLLVFLFVSCQTETIKEERSTPVSEFWLNVPEPSTNKASAAKIDLGQKLFFDPILSSDSTISCGSCHSPKLAFADSVSFSAGVDGRQATRNTPTIVNIAFLPHLMAEGGVKSLERQVIAPLENDLEMDLPVLEACRRLNRDQAYKLAFDNVWGDSATPFTLTRSIAAFERTIIGGQSRFDRFTSGDSSALSDIERRGFELFNSDDLNCLKCHSGILFTNHKLENNGLYETYADNGAFRLTLKESDLGRFKVPTLRNIARTAPYMHDGSLKSLEEVIDHYETGGHDHPNKSDKLNAFQLSDADRASLIAFLITLTDTTIIYGSK